jgi:hypothetical protein
MEEYHENRTAILRKTDTGFVVDLIEDGGLIKTIDLSQTDLDAEQISDNWVLGVNNE